MRGEMAQRGNQMDSEKLSCSICLDLLKDPVTTSCGHTYCTDCIKTHWDKEDQKRVYSCPQCRKTFTPRPVLSKHVLIAELVEDLKKTGLQAAAADHCYAGAEDVACDVCTGRKRKSIKSCLGCLTSYCEQHLQPHYDAPPLKKHQLVEPSKKLQENICSGHDEVMKIFCRTDQQLICYLCSMDEHKGHETVPAAAERTEKQKQLDVSRLNIQQIIQDTEKDVDLLLQELKAISDSAGKTVEDSEEMFNQMVHVIQKRSRDVEQHVKSQQQTEVSRIKELQKKLEQKIRDLKRKDAELKQLSDTQDHIQFLHNYPSVSALSESTHSSSINIRPLRHFEEVTEAVKELRDQLQDNVRDTWTNISLTITQPDVLLSNSHSEPKTRAGFLKCSREITLDPNTPHRYLVLSEGNRKVTFMRRDHDFSYTPGRFTGCWQVLSKESLTGRCYWEVEWRGGVFVAVAYKSFGREYRFGYDDKSWALCCKPYSFTFLHKRVETPVSGPQSFRVGVYLDHSAGILSFFSVSETMTLLHRVQTTFTEPLHVGFYLWNIDNTVEFIQPK